MECIICGSKEYQVLFPANKAQKQRIVKCTGCGFMYANPQSTEEISGKMSLEDVKYGRKEADAEKRSEEAYKGWLEVAMNYLVKQHVQMKDYQKVLDFLEEKAGKGKLLDIGAYAGVFVHHAQEQGWQVKGIEPMEHPAEYAKREFGIELIKESLEHAKFNDKFDAIVSFHVIEHVYNPLSFLKKIKEIINDNGILVLETPTYDSLMFKILKHRERSIRCDGHMFFFTQKSLNTLLENNGFKIIKNIKVGRTLTIARLLANVGIISGNKRLISFIENMNQRLGLEKLRFTLNTRDMQRVYCSLV